MKIISGSARGMNLKSPRGKRIRPTSQKVKAAFFNIVHDKIYGACFLDLFSGSGGMGLEALSRGAKACVLVDKNWDSIHLIRKNVELLKMHEKASIYHDDVFRALLSFSQEQVCFDIIYIDPPYQYDKIQEILFVIQEGRLLSEGGIIGVERLNRNDDALWGFSPFPLQQKKVYGDTALYILRFRE